MSDSEEKKHNKFVSAIAEIAHSQLGYFIRFGFMMLAIGIGSKWDGHIFDRKGCVEVREKSDHFFKVDTCNGTVEELAIEEVAQNKN
jgi:hypothetical protein